MIYPSLFLWLVALSMVLAGLRLSCFAGVDRVIARLPLWFCWVLVLAWCLVIYVVGLSPFGGLVFQVR